jgi:hypothetical protein
LGCRSIICLPFTSVNTWFADFTPVTFDTKFTRSTTSSYENMGKAFEQNIIFDWLTFQTVGTDQFTRFTFATIFAWVTIPTSDTLIENIEIPLAL